MKDEIKSVFFSKIILGIICPPYAIFGLDYLTQEELRAQPQTEQELEEQEVGGN